MSVTTSRSPASSLPLSYAVRQRSMIDMIIAYSILLLGTTLSFTVMFLFCADEPGSGRFIDVVPLVNLGVFWALVAVSRTKRKLAHLTVGLIATPVLWLLNVLLFGAIALSQSGLAGTQ